MLKRQVIVTDRRGGKTHKLLEKCVDALDRGKSVLFLSFSSISAKYTCEQFLDMVQHRTYVKYSSTLRVEWYKGKYIDFRSFDQYFGKCFIGEYDFKVADNIGIRFSEMNVVSVNGLENAQREKC